MFYYKTNLIAFNPNVPRCLFQPLNLKQINRNSLLKASMNTKTKSEIRLKIYLAVVSARGKN